MSRHVAEVLTYVSTTGGVVRLDPGVSVPDDADPDHVARLVAAGAVVEAPIEVGDLAPASDPAPVEAKTTRSRRGQSGSKAKE